MRMKYDGRFYGFGSAAIDFRITTADLGINYTEKLLARQVDMLPGGSVANCLAQINSLGGTASWLGKLGRDWIGDRIIEQLNASKIGTEQVVRDSTLCSPFNLAAYAGEKRRRVGGWLLPNSLSSVNDDDIAFWLQTLTDRDWLIIEIGEIPLDIILKLCQKGRERGIRIAIDVDLDPIVQCGSTHETIDAIFQTADLLIPNRNAVAHIFGTADPENLVKTICHDYRSVVVVTAGAQGVWACENNNILYQPAPDVEIVDTVGAGDAFHGGLIWALSVGQSLEQALTLATQCSGEACQKVGAR